MATKSEIIVDSNNTYVPNTSGLITPQLVQTLNTNWINASIFPEQTGSMSVQNAATASFLLGSVASASFSAFAVSASVAQTASLALRGNGNFTGSFSGSVSASFSGSGAGIFGVVSASNSISSSYSLTSSLAQRNIVTASVSVNIITFTKGDNSTFSLTVAQSGSVVSASYADVANQANSASLATTASFAISSSRAISSLSASYAFTASSAIAANTAVSATSATSALTSISASFATTAGTANTASFIAGVALLSANNTFTGITTFNNNVTASNVRITGTASIAFLDVTFQSSSVIYSSGSNQFGDASNDTQTLWGTVNVISGPLVVTGSANFKNVITGSISTALNANTASYVANAFISASQVGGNDKVSLTNAGGTTTTLTINNVASANNASTATTATSASFATTAGSANTATSASYAYTASSATNAASSISASYAYTASSATNAASSISASYAYTASSAVKALSSSYSDNANTANSSTSASYALSSSFALNSLTASYFDGLVASASYALVAETANTALSANVANLANTATSATSASYALSASFASTAETIVGAVVSASYAATASGVQTFNANGINDTYYLTFVQNEGIHKASFDTDLSYNPQTNILTGTITGAESALSASYAYTASSAVNAASSISASYAYTASSAISAGTASYAKNFIISGSQVITGSLVGQPVSQSVSSLTASLNLQAGNFFNLTLPASANTYITASGQVPGQTINLKITQQATTGSVTIGAGIKQVSGSAYTVTAVASAVDIVTFISFDNTGLYVSNVKNLV